MLRVLKYIFLCLLVVICVTLRSEAGRWNGSTLDSTTPYRKNAGGTLDQLTGYRWNGSTLAELDAGGADTTKPVFASGSIGINGTTLTINWTEASSSVSRGGGWANSQISVTCNDAGTLGYTYTSGDGTLQWIGELDGTVSNDTIDTSCTITFDGGSISIVDPSSNFVDDFGPTAITNGSAQGAAGITVVDSASYSGFGATASGALPTYAVGDLIVYVIGSDSPYFADANGTATYITNGLYASTMSTTAYYRVADGDETDPASFSLPAADDWTLHIVVFHTPSGTWTAPNTAGYFALVSAGPTDTYQTTALTAHAGDAAYVVWLNDGNASVTSRTPDTPAIAGSLENPSSAFSGVAYTQTGLTSGSKQWTLVWSIDTEEGQAIAILASTTAP